MVWLHRSPLGAIAALALLISILEINFRSGIYVPLYTLVLETEGIGTE